MVSLAVFVVLLLQVTSTSARNTWTMISPAQSRGLVEEQTILSKNVPVERDAAADSPQDSELSTRNLVGSTENKKETTHDENDSTATDRNLEHNFNYEPKPYYKQYQTTSSMTTGQKIGILAMLLLTVALAIYTCVLRYELSTLNVYSLLGRDTNTAEDDEEKVGDAYGRRLEMI